MFFGVLTPELYKGTPVSLSENTDAVLPSDLHGDSCQTNHIFAVKRTQKLFQEGIVYLRVVYSLHMDSSRQRLSERKLRTGECGMETAPRAYASTILLTTSS